MLDRSSAIEFIASAFSSVRYPGDANLIDSREGDEPLRVEAEFRGRDEWNLLSKSFLDQSPSGLGSALTYFSDEAFHFYIAAYMLADFDGEMERSDPIYYLAPRSAHPLVAGLEGPNRLALGTWGRYASLRFHQFTQAQRMAVAEYLMHRSQLGDLFEDQVECIGLAVRAFWLSDTAEISEVSQPARDA